jgi:SPP1 family predicted phage head-tail adaptor
MRIGEMTDRITFQEFQEWRDEYDFPHEDWVDVKSVWSRVETVSGRRFYEAAAVQMEQNKTFHIRYHKDLHDRMRVLFRGDKYEIQSLMNDDEKNVSMTVVVKKVEA